jgi:putative Mg2+ transporter-C (MgtC) family protein
MLHLTVPGDTFEMILRLSAAAAAGGVIGLERYIQGRSAGLRTHVLVCVGSALFTIFSLIAPFYNNAGGEGADPGRIAAQIVTGIGFLGAGVILKQGVTVRGLTTAACLWVAAGIGMTAAGGLYFLTLFVTALTVVTLFGLNLFELKFHNTIYRHVTVVTDLGQDVSGIIEKVNSSGVTVFGCDSERDFETGRMKVEMDVRLLRKGSTQPLADKALKALHESKIPVHSFSWRREAIS